MNPLPYWAIVKDEFRAVTASRVLYVLLALITVLLLLVAPLHIRESADWEVSELSVGPVATEMAKELYEKNAQNDPVVTRIWDRLTPQTREEISKRVQSVEPTPGDVSQDDEEDDRPGRRRGRGQLGSSLIADLNTIMQQDDFYDPAIWKSRVLDSETQGLIDEGPTKLSKPLQNRLNRILIKASLQTMPAPQKASAKIYYGPFHASIVPPDLGRATILLALKSTLSLILDKFVMSLGLLIAIIVTAGMIPEMFDPGSLNLLLSKPISRFGLLISKFVGGTAFVALCSIYLFVGLWLWMGLALGSWNASVLWSIPLYLLSFAIYFSVSVFAGLVYRSAIVAVVVTGVFWAFCYAVGSVYGFINARVQNDDLAGAIKISNGVVAVNKFHQLVAINPVTNAWEPQSKSPGLEQGQEIGLGVMMYTAEIPVFPVVHPVVDNNDHSVLFLTFHPMAIGQYRSPELVVYDPEKRTTSQWKSTNAISLLNSKHGPILVSNSGKLQRIDVGQLVSIENANSLQSSPIPDAALKSIGPSLPQFLSEPSQIAIDPKSEQIVSFSDRRLSVHRLEGEQYVTKQRVEIDNASETSRMSSIVGTTKNFAVVAFGNARVVLVDTTTMNVVNAYQPESKDPPLAVAANPEQDLFYVLFRNGRVWMLDSKTPSEMTLASLPHQGDISGISFDDQNRLTLNHTVDQVTTIEPQAGNETTRISSPILTTLYRYIIKPIYLICPKPSEFYKLVNFLSQDSNDDPARSGVDLRESDPTPNPWSPLWSGIVFMVAMLATSGIHFVRSDC